MFSQASVILTIGGHAWRVVCVSGAYMAGGVWWGVSMVGEACMVVVGGGGRACIAREMPTAVDGTHAAGIHSGFHIVQDCAVLECQNLMPVLSPLFS